MKDKLFHLQQDKLYIFTERSIITQYHGFHNSIIYCVYNVYILSAVPEHSFFQSCIWTDVINRN